MKTLILAIFALAFIAAGCDREVSRVQLDSYVESRSVSCSYFGYCLTCMPSMFSPGTLDCGLKFSNFCAGRQDATVNVMPYEIRYESGTVRTFENIDVLKTRGDCQ